MPEKLFGFGDFAGTAYRERLFAKAGLDKKVRGLRALELGCGPGREALYLAERGWQVDAVDMEAHATWPALAKQSRGRVRFSTGDAQALKRPSNRYDLVLEKDMAHHADDPAKAFAELRRVAKPGAPVMIIEGNRLNPIFYVHLTLMEGHEHFTLGRLRRLLAAAGMADATVQKVEARVWPINRAGAQRFMDKVQDVVEKIPGLRALACYHVARWHKPKKAL
jgi:ubiquinone/menaquinone biosynthesis C-methylase UbiE